ncbi:EAL domain-containing protein [Idiomarina aminovorans]|uniref:EAL domain-containing protein n=1 Tax=Idiomarina aminovorans TaxID=2914829 RepID=UPI002005BAE9|nr:EAL domain-containing protein [Idiomarina sp. ATCH4]MCK7460037.1 EAL domain-containing protein [Idiomarina sp. ATCH4]
MKNIFVKLPLSGLNYYIKAKFERIEKTDDSRVQLELLSSVKRGQMMINPKDFYAKLSSSDIFFIYDKMISQIDGEHVSTVFVNTPYNFLFSDCIIDLIKNNNHVFLCFELPEETGSILFIDIEERVRQLKSKSEIHFFLDDFGTKNSNFDFLSMEGLDGVKLSKELFWHLYENNRVFLRELICFLKARGTVVVEGVDRVDRYKFCCQSKVLMQGHFIKSSAESRIEYV